MGGTVQEGVLVVIDDESVMWSTCSALRTADIDRRVRCTAFTCSRLLLLFGLAAVVPCRPSSAFEPQKFDGEFASA